MAKISIHNDVVRITQSTKVKGNISVELTQEYDFTNTPKATLIQWATANRVIAWRAHNNVKSLTIEDIRALPTIIDCTEEFESARKPKVKDPFTAQMEEISVKTGVSMTRLLEIAAIEAAKVMAVKMPVDELIKHQDFARKQLAKADNQ